MREFALAFVPARQHPQTTYVPHVWGMGVVGGCARAVPAGPPPPWLHSYTFFIAAILLWENDDVCIVLFYSVIYNSEEYTYNGDHSISPFFINKIRFINFLNCFITNDVHFSRTGLGLESKHYLKFKWQCTQWTVYLNFNSCSKRLCDWIGPNQRKDDSCDCTLAIYGCPCMVFNHSKLQLSSLYSPAYAYTYSIL